MSHKIRLPGVLLGADLITCFSQSHILAVPSYMEGLALVYLEGMYYGLVPLASSGRGGGRSYYFGAGRIFNTSQGRAGFDGQPSGTSWG